MKKRKFVGEQQQEESKKRKLQNSAQQAWQHAYSTRNVPAMLQLLQADASCCANLENECVYWTWLHDTDFCLHKKFQDAIPKYCIHKQQQIWFPAEQHLRQTQHRNIHLPNGIFVAATMQRDYSLIQVILSKYEKQQFLQQVIVHVQNFQPNEILETDFLGMCIYLHVDFLESILNFVVRHGWNNQWQWLHSRTIHRYKLHYFSSEDDGFYVQVTQLQCLEWKNCSYLYLAAFNGNIEACKLLIARGCDAYRKETSIDGKESAYSILCELNCWNQVRACRPTWFGNSNFASVWKDIIVCFDDDTLKNTWLFC